jgi:hypothetical protein
MKFWTGSKPLNAPLRPRHVLRRREQRRVLAARGARGARRGVGRGGGLRASRLLPHRAGVAASAIPPQRWPCPRHRPLPLPAPPPAPGGAPAGGRTALFRRRVRHQVAAVDRVWVAAALEGVVQLAGGGGVGGGGGGGGGGGVGGERGRGGNGSGAAVCGAAAPARPRRAPSFVRCARPAPPPAVTHPQPVADLVHRRVAEPKPAARGRGRANRGPSVRRGRRQARALRAAGAPGGCPAPGGVHPIPPPLTCSPGTCQAGCPPGQ